MPSVKPEVWTLLGLGLLLPALAQAADTLSPPAPREEINVTQLSETAAPEQAEVLPPGATVAETAEAKDTAAPAETNVLQTQAEPLAGMGSSIAVDSLDQYRGGTSVNSIRSEAVSNGLLQDATATNVATGTNSIADGAFSNAVGLPIVIQNSGANVLIQNSTIVNVQFR